MYGVKEACVRINTEFYGKNRRAGSGYDAHKKQAEDTVQCIKETGRKEMLASLLCAEQAVSGPLALTVQKTYIRR